jgi:hypothetical protein
MKRCHKFPRLEISIFRRLKKKIEKSKELCIKFTGQIDALQTINLFYKCREFYCDKEACIISLIPKKKKRSHFSRLWLIIEVGFL